MKCVVWRCYNQTDGIRLLCLKHAIIAKGESIRPSPPPTPPITAIPKQDQINPGRQKRKKSA